eukprot:COSAG01_NODE_61596_length_288_cov_3.761905_1_plen_69_part_00
MYEIDVLRAKDESADLLSCCWLIPRVVAGAGAAAVRVAAWIGHFSQGVGFRSTYTEIQGGTQTTPPPP